MDKSDRQINSAERTIHRRKPYVCANEFGVGQMAPRYVPGGFWPLAAQNPVLSLPAFGVLWKSLWLSRSGISVSSAALSSHPPNRFALFSVGAHVAQGSFTALCACEAFRLSATA
jgi:hypothetical protein